MPSETTHGTPSLSPQEIHWVRLRAQAEIYADLQEMRKAIGNRLFQTKKRGIFDPVLGATIEQLQDMEAAVGKEMETCLADALPEVVPWVEKQPGVGLLSLARLLAQTGHPVFTVPHHWEGKGGKRKLVADAPMTRTVGQLWQYCGVGGPSKKKKGELGFWNPQAKMCAYLVATNCMKQKGKGGYRAVYDARRLRTADKKHSELCVRCGPSGKPAQVGSEWSDGHAMADALRIVSKELLRDLWVLCNTQDDGARPFAKPTRCPPRRPASHGAASIIAKTRASAQLRASHEPAATSTAKSKARPPRAPPAPPSRMP